MQGIFWNELAFANPPLPIKRPGCPDLAQDLLEATWLGTAEVKSDVMDASESQ